MAKMKTHRASAKRYKSHITGKKSPKRIRNLRKGSLVSKSDQRRIDHMIP